MFVRDTLEPFGARRQLVRASAADEQLVVKHGPQFTQRAAHRGLAHVLFLGGA